MRLGIFSKSVFYEAGRGTHGITERPFIRAAGAEFAFRVQLVDVSLGAHDVHVGLARLFALVAEHHIVCKAVINAVLAVLFLLRRQGSGVDVFVQSHFVFLPVKWRARA